MQLTFAPLLPLWIIYTALTATLIMALWGYLAHMRATTLRMAAGLLLVSAIANPTISHEQRTKLSTVVPILVDRSQSQMIGERDNQTNAALAVLERRLAQDPLIDIRVINAKTANENGRAETLAFAALHDAIRDVPPSRLGAAFFITDGQIHDIPSDASTLPSDIPINALITGNANEYDRRIEINEAPRFGLVGESLPIEFTVVNDGPVSQAQEGASPAIVTVRMNGKVVTQMRVNTDVVNRYMFDIKNGGENIIELSVTSIAGELTSVNNRVVQIVEGIRENLRVLLVSGSPHAGERTWRNLLKSDASVDLVHFTILRPPEKQDGTPINELSLIAFPTQELFVDKINDFDLIILDRYQNRNVLPLLYYDNIAQYVHNGGALLVAAGPEIAGPQSIASTPLSSVLPAIPTGDIREGGFYPTISETGKKHPVTRGLPGAGKTPPDWGQWFQSISVGPTRGETVMTADGQPLLILSHEGKGRVAEFLSDQGWLWARGFEGGGPYVQLYRRIAHWLMKEPALEEEALTAYTNGQTLKIIRQTMDDSTPANATILTPSGKVLNVSLTEIAPGHLSAATQVDEMGIFTVKSGGLQRIVNVGNPNAAEFEAMISTIETLTPLANASHGHVFRIDNGSDDGRILPPVRVSNASFRTANDGRMSIISTSDTKLESIRSLPLFNGPFGLIALLALISMTWWREGRS